MPTVHIESSKEDIASIVIMPGDPKRAEYIAKKYLKNTKIVNLVRKMTAYTGTYKNKKITIFPSGMGNPSMGIYSYELFNDYQVNTIIRVGSMGSYLANLKLNDILLVDNSISNSTYAKVLDNYDKMYVQSSSDINNIIIKTATENNIALKKGNIFCSDVFYSQNNDFVNKIKNYQVCGEEMETFALFNNARHLNKKCACLLTVSDSFIDKTKLTSKQREQSFDKMIILALETSLKL